MTDTRSTATGMSDGRDVDQRSDAPSNRLDDRMPSDRVDELLRALSEPRRRRVVEYVEGTERATLRELAEYVAERESFDRSGVDDVALSLYHSHVPRLVDAGILAYDGDEKRVRKGGRFDDAALVQ